MDARDYKDALIFDKNDFPLLLKVAIYIDLQESNGNDLVFSEGKLISHRGGKQQEVDDDYIGFLTIKNWDTDDLIELLSLCIDCLCRRWKLILAWLKSGGKKVILKDVPPSEALYYKYVSNDVPYFNCAKCGALSFTCPSEFDDIFDCAKANLNGLANPNQLKILCLAQSHNIDAMWGYYGNKFKGLCFGYKAKDIFASLMKGPIDCHVVCFGDVDYGARPIFKKSQTIISQIEERMLKCFDKEKSWSYQKESRFIGFFPKTTDKKYAIIKAKVSEQYHYDLKNKTLISDAPRTLMYPNCKFPYKTNKCTTKQSLIVACQIQGNKERTLTFRDALLKMLMTMFPPSLVKAQGRNYKGEESIQIKGYCPNILPEINFVVGDKGLRIPLAFGTTMVIARKIYPVLSSPFSLTFDGHCTTKPSFHLADTWQNMNGTKGRVDSYVSGGVDYKKYFGYWNKNAAQLKQTKGHQELQEFLASLSSKGIIDADETQKLINAINSNQNKYSKKINIVPETMVEISWTYQDIIQFKTDDDFKKKLEEFFNDIFRYLGVK